MRIVGRLGQPTLQPPCRLAVSPCRCYFDRMSVAEIQRVVAGLSDNDRGTLAAWLLESLPPHNGEDATDDSFREAARRTAELDSGMASPVSSEDFWAAIARDRASWT